MNIVYICSKLYPGQTDAGNIRFYQPEDKILIQYWAVPGIEQPTEDYLESLFPTYERQCEIDDLTANATALIQIHIDSTAKTKGYNDAVSCASYATCANAAWQAEAIALISWRDACWVYAYNLLAQAQAGGAIPTIDEVMSGLPVISW